MATPKIKVGILLGGQSAEHEVSLQSARSIFEAIDKNRFEVWLIGIAKNGNWYHLDPEEYLNYPDDPDKISLKYLEERQIALIPHHNSHRILAMSSGKFLGQLDVAFNIIHGTHGEDGGLQGFFNILNLAFVGADVLGSAVGMDKDCAKILLLYAGVPVADFVTLYQTDYREDLLANQVAHLGWPLFVKPSSSGSSIGVQKARNFGELVAAVQFAFRFDTKVLIEEFVEGREIECSVLGNENIEVSLAGEIIPQHDFYSYEAKYIDKQGAKLVIPAPLTEEQMSSLKALARKSFVVLNCKGFARIDFFLSKQGKLILNEINTLPGFTSISMYPKLWEVSGLPYPDLITRLIELGIERHQQKQKLQKNIISARSGSH